MMFCRVILVALGVFAASCTVAASRSDFASFSCQQSGVASWYGPGFHGRLTSNGETYDMYGLTAAHRTLPFGIDLKVTRVDNGRSVIVTVNDRGPFIPGRFLDLSYAAAQALDMIGPGTAQVDIEVIGKSGDQTPGDCAERYQAHYTVQVGAFANFENALALKQSLEHEDQPVYIRTFHAQEQDYYQVRIGTFQTRDQAQRLSSRLESDGQLSSIILWGN